MTDAVDYPNTAPCHDLETNMTTPSKVTHLPAVMPAQQQNRLTDFSGFDSEEQAFIEETFEAFSLRRNSRGQRAQYDDGVINTMRDFFAFTGLGPWSWTEDGFDEWNDYLIHKRGVRRTTQSTYQNHVRAYQGFIVENQTIQQRCQVTFGCRIERIATRYNCIVHKTENGSESRRRNFTKDEVQAFSGAIRDEYVFKKQGATKGLFAVARDLALFALLFDAGLRIDECLGIRYEHFDYHPQRPECGRYAKIAVWGKASKGNPKPKRVVPINDTSVAKLLDWYATHIRPRALHLCDANETAFWLSERGRPVSYSAIWERFHKYKVAANLERDHGLVMHSTRHTSVDRDLSEGTPMVAVQRKHGHVSAGTTSGYSHTTDQYVEDNYAEAMQRRRAMLDNPNSGRKE